jgi:hypothetical protein
MGRRVDREGLLGEACHGFTSQLGQRPKDVLLIDVNKMGRPEGTNL